MFACQLQVAALEAINDARRKGAPIVVRGYQVKQRMGRKLLPIRFPVYAGAPD